MDIGTWTLEFLTSGGGKEGARKVGGGGEDGSRKNGDGAGAGAGIGFVGDGIFNSSAGRLNFFKKF